MYAWLLAHPANMMPIVGSGKLDRKNAALATNVKLDRQQWFTISKALMDILYHNTQKEELFLYSSFFLYVFLVIANTHISLNPFPSTAILALSKIL